MRPRARVLAHADTAAAPAPDREPDHGERRHARRAARGGRARARRRLGGESGVRRRSPGTSSRSRRHSSARPAAGSRTRSSARASSSRSRRAMALPVGVLVAIYLTEFAPRAVAGADSARARRPQRAAVDRDRHLHLRPARDRPPAERLRRRHRARDHHAAARRAFRRRRCCCSCPPTLREASLALGVSRWRTRARRDPPDELRRHPHRDGARGRARGRRDGAAPLHVLDLHHQQVERTHASRCRTSR